MNAIENLGEHIRRARLEMGWSQEKLAELLDITPTHVKHLESGHRKPSAEVLFSLAKLLNMSLDNLIFRENDLQNQTIQQIENLLPKCSQKDLNVTLDILKSLLKNQE